MIDVNRLEVLVTFARTGNVTAAAEELHFSQPTVSHHLHKLEAETGAQLVRRVGRGLILTPAGERLAERGEEILGLVARAERELQAAVSLETGTVRLAIFPSAVATLGPRIVEETHRRHPGLQLEVTEAEPPQAERMVLAQEADLALAFTYPSETGSEAVNSEVLGLDPLYLVSPPADAVGAKATWGAHGRLPKSEKMISLDDLGAFAKDPWMAGCERCRGYLVSTCGAAGFTPGIAFASDDYVAIQSMVAVGQGVTLLPRLALQAHRHPDVVVTPVDGASRSLRLLSLGRPPLPPALEAVSEVVRDLVADAEKRELTPSAVQGV